MLSRYGSHLIKQTRRHVRTLATCPKCQHSTPCSFICPTCNSIKDVDSNCSHFDLLNLPKSFDVTSKEIDMAYKTLQKKLHPDLHHQNPESAELASSHSTRINMACDVLSDPVLRAQHLMLTTNGEDPLAEGTIFQNDPELLMFVMEARQTIEDVATENAEELYQHHQTMMNEVVTEMSETFTNDNSDIEKQTKALIKLQYVSRMLETITDLKPVV